MKKLVLTLLVSALLYPAAVFGQVTNEIAASANAYVFRGSASSDQDESQTLNTKRLNDSNTRIAYVRFNIASFLTNNQVANITSARLRLYNTSSAGDTVNVYGLDNVNANGVSDGAWTANMTWNNQPAKTASPNDIGGSASALPNGNTTPLLGSQGFTSTAGEVDVALNVSTFQNLLIADTNQQITLLFHNVGGNTIGWASISNTSGNLVPTLEIAATPSSNPIRALTWDGTINGNWDTNTTNWKTNPATASTFFNQADVVTFDDSKAGTPTVTLSLPVTPSGVTVSNSAANYTFTGSGRISGIYGITKLGSGTLTINTSNDFSGPVIVSGGTLKAGNSFALGSGASSTTVTNGATLEINGISLVSEPVRVSGSGVGGNGAVVNSGATQTSGLRNVTLLGDTTFGGTGRWDIRAASTSSTSGCSLSTGGQPYKLIKVGTNQFSLVAVGVDSALGDIEVRQGVLSAEVATSSLGNPANTLSVSNGATLQFYQNSAVLNKNILLAGGATLFNNSGANIFAGPITLQGNATLNIGGTSLTLNNGISGAGALTKTGSGALTVNGVSSYTGGTTLSAGKLELYGTIGGTLTAASGTTLAGTFTNTGTASVSGSIHPGDDNVAGTMAANGWTMNSSATATFELFPGSSDLLQVNGNLVLNNNTITIVPLATLQAGVPYTLVNYTGTRTGTFNPVLNLDTNFSATLDYSTPGQINVIFSKVETFTIPTQYPTGPGPANITVGPDNKLIYWPDTNGDTIPDFSKAGYRAGEVPIPDVPVVTNLSPIIGDNSAQIQGAIEALKALPLGTNGLRGAILLAPGIYVGSGTITVDGAGIVLRGSGDGTNGSILRGMSISISGGSRSSGSTTYNITSDYVPLGANWFAVDNVNGLNVGDEIKITRPSNGTWLDAVYPPGGKDSWIGAVNNVLYRKIVKIEQNRVMIDAPLVIAYDNIHGFGGASFVKSTYSGTQDAGIEYLRVDRLNDTLDTNGNTGGVMMDFGGVQNCWIRHVYNDRMNGHTMDVGGARYITIEDVTSFHMPLIYRASSATVQNFTFSYGGQGLLFHRCVTSYGGSEFTSGPAGSGPTVFSECTIPAAVAFTGPHMKYTCGVLYDAIFANQPFQTFKNDSSHGYGGANHLAWNCEASSYHFDRPPTAHQWNIGCIGTVDPAEPRSGALPCERISQGKHLEPGSLFRAQLAERIGQERAYAVLGYPDGANPFEIVALPETNSVAAGQSTNCPILLAVPPDYAGQTVAFSVSGLPFGVSASFATDTLNSGGTNVLSIVASNNAPVGTYRVILKGAGTFPVRGGGSALTTRTISMILNVTGPNNFFVSADPYSQSVVPGTNTSFSVTIVGTNGFNGSVALSITNLPAGVSASFSPPTVSGAGTSTLTLTVSNNALAGSYTFTVLAANNGLTSGATANLTVISTALPAPWIDTDIGSQTNTGSATYINSVFNGLGGGSDVWGTSDQFNYIFQPQSGDFSITARVTSQTATDPWAKAGVMIRETTNSNSKYIFAMVSPTASHGVSVQYRTTTGGSAVDAADISGPTVPYWLRLVRSGTNFTSFMSSDGATWNQIANGIPITMSSNVMVGLAVCAHNSSALSKATFDNVSIDYPYFTLSISPDTQSVNGNDSASYTVSLQNYFGFSGNVALSVDGIPPYSTALFSPVSISGTNTSTLTIITTNITPPDSYNLDVTGTNGVLSDDESAELDVTNSIDSDGDGIPDWWMQQTFGHATGQAADLTRAQDDFDGDGMSNFAEYISGTDPTDPESYLHLLSVAPNGTDETVSWAAVGGINYVVQISTNIGAGFIDASPLLTPDSDGETVQSWTDAGAATNSPIRFYRIRIGP